MLSGRGQLDSLWEISMINMSYLLHPPQKSRLPDSLGGVIGDSFETSENAPPMLEGRTG